MRFLQCLICCGELDIIKSYSHTKQVVCRECGYNSDTNSKTVPEVQIIKKRPLY